MDEIKVQRRILTTEEVFARLRGIYTKLGDFDADTAEGYITALEAQLATAQRERDESRRLAQWTPITPENLPKVGDEVLSVGEEGEAYLMAPWSDKDSFADLSRDGWTHYRPITPPEVKP